MKNSGFAAFHPVVNLVFFIFAIALSVTLMHPACLFISLACAVIWAVLLDKKRSLGFMLKAVLPMSVLAAALNPLFNHGGQTILTYFPNGNPLTLESIVYGAAAAGMLGAVLMWFFCLNRIIGSEKLTFLFGRAAPALALVFSMSLRFVPRFSAKFQEVSSAQRALYGIPREERLFSKIKRGTRVLSITVTWSLENAVDTAGSMKSRGYGLRGRTAISLYHFTKRDGFLLTLILIFGGAAVSSAATAMQWQFFPDYYAVFRGGTALAGFVSYFCLCVSPLIIDALEVRRWKRLDSKI